MIINKLNPSVEKLCWLKRLDTAIFLHTPCNILGAQRLVLLKILAATPLEASMDTFYWEGGETFPQNR